jgi:hypothetical protein
VGFELDSALNCASVVGDVCFWDGHWTSVTPRPLGPSPPHFTTESEPKSNGKMEFDSLQACRCISCRRSVVTRRSLGGGGEEERRRGGEEERRRGGEEARRRGGEEERRRGGEEERRRGGEEERRRGGEEERRRGRERRVAAGGGRRQTATIVVNFKMH